MHNIALLTYSFTTKKGSSRDIVWSNSLSYELSLKVLVRTLCSTMGAIFTELSSGFAEFVLTLQFAAAV